MTTEIRSSDIVLWLRVRRPHVDLGALEWGVPPLQSVTDDVKETDLVSFAADAILTDKETLSGFLCALTKLRSSANVTVIASVAVYFDHTKAMQNFLLPADFIEVIGSKLHEVEISVYSTESASSTEPTLGSKA